MTDIEKIADSVGSIKKHFENNRYICSDEIATAVFLAYKLKKPVLIEGPPGVGKTSERVAPAIMSCVQNQIPCLCSLFLHVFA